MRRLDPDDGVASTGRLMFNILGAIAQFERERMFERQREGIAKAKAEGKYKGRAPTARVKSDDVRRLKREGVGNILFVFVRIFRLRSSCW